VLHAQTVQCVDAAAEVGLKSTVVPVQHQHLARILDRHRERQLQAEQSIPGRARPTPIS
jgi:hypothetical protein